MTLQRNLILLTMASLLRFSAVLFIALIFSDFTAEARSRGGKPAPQDDQALSCYAVDVEPRFPGGEDAMIKFINAERRYPAEAYANGVQGRVTCRFVVNADGSLSDIMVIRGVEESLDQEAMRIVSAMPAWEAAQLMGQPVAAYFIVTIPFRR